jgi:hypothetical protein
MTRYLLAILLLGALAACKIGEDEKTFPVAANCSPVGNACASHSDCCSFGCEMGVCAANPLQGGACRTSNDCDWTMYCANGACEPAVAGSCHLTSDVCGYNNECCSGNCVGDDQSVYPPVAGACQVNTAPGVDLGGDRQVPYYVTATLTATVTDPDADQFVYGWTLQSGPPGHGLGAWTSNLASPSFFPDVPGAYVFSLVVTDGPPTQRGRLTTTAAPVTITAANLPPTVSAGADVPSQLRNVALSVVGAVSDPNGTASPVTCAWHVTPPASAEYPAQSYSPCPAAPAFTFTPPVDGPEGDWALRLEASDGTLTASDTRIVHVVNGPPVANAGADRVGNLGPPGVAASAIPLSGSATDPNGDVGTAGFTWTWTVSAVNAPGTAWTVGDVVGTAAAASFVPDAMGTYTLDLHVDDGRGGTHDDLVTVTAERYLRPLLSPDGSGLPRGEIADAVYVKATNRIVMVGTDRSGASATPPTPDAHRLWIVDPDPDPATQTATVEVTLDAQPVCLALSPDGQEALVGQVGAKWQHVTGLGGTPAKTSATPYGLAFTPNTLVHAGTRWYAFGPTGTVYELFNTGTTAPAGCQNCTLAGTRAVRDAGGTAVWVLNEAADMLSRYDIHANGNFNQNPTSSVAGLALVDRLWLSADGQDVVLGNGSVYVTSSLAPDGTSLPFAPLHFDSTVVSTALQGVAFPAPGATLTRLSASYASTGTLAVPQLGVDGTGYPSSARFAFLRSDGTAHYAVVRATVAFADRYYLAAY